MKPKFHYANFHRNFPRGKSWTQITKVADTNHLDMSRCLRQSPWQVRDKAVCVALMEFSPLQCKGKVGDKVMDLSRTQIMEVGDVICVMDFCDLCPWQVHNFVGNLSRTLSQSRHNGIWALADFHLFEVNSQLSEPLSGILLLNNTRHVKRRCNINTSTATIMSINQSITTYNNDKQFTIYFKKSKYVHSLICDF